MTVKIYQVGGSVRDELLGVQSKDIDFTVEAPSFDAMREWLKSNGFTIFLETPQFLTIRARFPKGHCHARQTADFVLARRDGAYSDGRRPDEVIPGTIYDDLARRDFTVNAIAKDEDGNFIDPFDGRRDLEAGFLRAVGDPEDRIREDSLRALRAIRFHITKDLMIDDRLWDVLCSPWLPPLLANVSTERKREEMIKMFKFDTLAAMDILFDLPRDFSAVVFDENLWLKPTMEDK